MSRAPWYHWPVAVLAVLWHLVGALDFGLTQLRVPLYLNQFTLDQQAVFTDLPGFIVACWAVGTWVGLLGAWLLLRRSAASVLVLALSLAGIAVATFYMLWISMPRMVTLAGPVGVWIMLGAVALALLFYLYARAMRVAGVLGGG